MTTFTVYGYKDDHSTRRVTIAKDLSTRTAADRVIAEAVSQGYHDCSVGREKNEEDDSED